MNFDDCSEYRMMPLNPLQQKTTQRYHYNIGDKNIVRRKVLQQLLCVPRTFRHAVQDIGILGLNEQDERTAEVYQLTGSCPGYMQRIHTGGCLRQRVAKKNIKRDGFWLTGSKEGRPLQLDLNSTQNETEGERLVETPAREDDEKGEKKTPGLKPCFERMKICNDAVVSCRAALKNVEHPQCFRDGLRPEETTVF
ncbi:uncharacterized protein LOC111031248 [Myzus persicae]|uniref:uncharacterized protein LOC111031248 n=1 Tax=Myzus persicae TaxID=13164 RepID=UPI000B931FB3|nr:uncharacterized protein LOC111031248 [Myzus persicae]